MKKLIAPLLILGSIQASAQDLLKFAADQAFNPQESARVGIEVEMSGISTKNIADIVHVKVGGRIAVVPNEVGVPEYHLLDSQLGKVIVKPEDNGTSSLFDYEEGYKKTRITEIVTEPLHFAQVEKLQLAMDALVAAGAEGTKEGHAVSIQTNEEIGKGRPQDHSTRIVLDHLRNFLSTENRRNIQQSLQPAEFRQTYVGPFSEGFMRKLFSPAYDPSWREFYDDFMYRQSAEVIGINGAWERPLEQIRKLVMRELNANGFEKIMRVVKWNDIRISSLMIFNFPEEALSKYLVKTTWFRGYPAIENRVRDNDFNVVRAVRENLGISRLSRDFGVFNSASSNDYIRYQTHKVRLCTNVFGI